MLTDNTPLETYEVNGVPILVKREDLCCPFPGPGFSKLRGVLAHIRSRPEEVIGVLDTYHSKAGWAVSYVCRELGKRAINFWPEYTADRKDRDNFSLRPQQLQAAHLGALLVALPAGRSAILYHRVKKLLPEGAYMMPNALKLPESVTENAIEVTRTKLPPAGVMVISISSGTVAAGVLRGLQTLNLLDHYHIVLHMGYSRSANAVHDYIHEVGYVGDFKCLLVDEGYSYADAAHNISAPFPANPYYDLKAWKWLSRPGVASDLAKRYGPIVFWNIGE